MSAPKRSIRRSKTTNSGGPNLASGSDQVPPPLQGVQRLREKRLRKPGDPSLATIMDQQLREIRKLQRGVGACAAAWGQVVPPELAARTQLISLNRGVLLVGVPDASTRFQLDRLLRAGGDRAFRESCKADVRSIRVVLASGQ